MKNANQRCMFPPWIGGPHWHSLDGRSTLYGTKNNTVIRLSGHSADKTNLFGHTTSGPATLQCNNLVSSTLNSVTYVARILHGW